MRHRLLCAVALAALWTACASAQPAAPAPAPAPSVSNPAAAKAPAAKPADGATVQGVTVTAEPPSDVRTSIDRRSYSLANDLQATTGSVADALRNIPSVEVDVQGNVSLRGDPNVTILIDGRPSAMMRGQSRADALQQLPADQIDRVEVMTNPSAAFKPDGGAGIINLVTKKGRPGARTATVRLNGGAPDRLNGGVSAAYNGKRLSLSADAGGRRDGSHGMSTLEQRRLEPATGRWVDRRDDTGIDGKNDMAYLRLGVDYDLDARTRVGGNLSHYDGRYHFHGPSTVAGAAPYGLDHLRQDYDVAGRWRSGSASANLRRKFSGEEHEFTLDLSTNRNRNAYQSDVANTPALPTAFEISGLSADARESELKADYKRPLPVGAKLQAGYELNVQHNAYGNRLSRGPSLAEAAPDLAFTNDFGFRQTIQALYATYQQPFGDVTIMPGLRVEEVRTRLDQLTLGTASRHDYLRAYPTLHLAYKLGEAQQLTASFSRRVQRPSPEDLNPFRFYSGPLDYKQGNPDLKPQITDSFELGWQLKKEATYYLATLYYRRGRAGVTDVVRELGDGVVLTTKANLSRSETAGLELVANGRLAPKLTYNVSGNLLWSEIDAAGVDVGPGGGAGRRSAAAMFGRGNLNWQPTDRDFFQLNGQARGRVLIAQGYREPSAILNLGYRRKMSDRLFLVATAQDLLDSTAEATVIETPTLQSRSERHVSQRAVFLGLSYSLGGSRRKAPEPAFDFGGGGGPG